MKGITTTPQPSWLPQPADLLPLLVSVSDAQRLLALGRADILSLIAEGHLQGVIVSDGTRRITTFASKLRRTSRRSRRHAPWREGGVKIGEGPPLGKGGPFLRFPVHRRKQRGESCNAFPH
jgi:hypothetical protein